MIIKLEEITVQSRAEWEMIDVTAQVEQVLAETRIKNGLVNVMTKHTTSGIVVTEGLECLEQDELEHLDLGDESGVGSGITRHESGARADCR